MFVPNPEIQLIVDSSFSLKCIAAGKTSRISVSILFKNVLKYNPQFTGSS